MRESEHPIAERRYQYRGRQILAVLYAPRMTARERRAWDCTYEISGLDRELRGTVQGVDALQALSQGMQALRLRLESLGAGLLWQPGQPGNTGIDRPISWIYGLRHSRKMESIVRRETERTMAEMAEHGRVLGGDLKLRLSLRRAAKRPST